MVTNLRGAVLSGQLSLVVPGISDVASAQRPAACAALDGDPRPGQVVFCVTLLDRAGHKSPPACTPPVAIHHS